MLGQYIVVRETLDVELHMLGVDQDAGLQWALDYAQSRNMRDARAIAARSTFGSSALDALMVSPIDAAIALAETYTGPASDQVRAMAALVALGEPIPNGSEDSGPSDGGARDRLPTGPQPMTPGPARVS